MKFLILLTFTLFSLHQLNAQKFEPTKEEIQKYGTVLADIFKETGLNIRRGNLPSNEAISRFDSLYATDTNSLFLNGFLLELNLTLIYDSARTERVLPTINAFNRVLRLTNEKHSSNSYFTLAGLYKYIGDYETAINSLNKSLALETDTQFRDNILNNLASTYNSAGKNKEALQTVRRMNNIIGSTVGRGSLLSEIYYKNGMYDSAIYFANSSIKTDKAHYSAYIYKAKALIKKGKTKEVCELATKAKAIMDENNFEPLLAQRDPENTFIKELSADLKEAKELKMKYCN